MNQVSVVGHMGVGRGARRGATRPARAGGGGSGTSLLPDAIWSYLCTYMVEHNGRPPAARQIADHLGGRSLSVVAKALARLEEEGRIRRVRYGEARAIEIVGATYTLPAGAREP